jgi:hypothetical protein
MGFLTRNWGEISTAEWIAIDVVRSTASSLEMRKSATRLFMYILWAASAVLWEGLCWYDNRADRKLKRCLSDEIMTVYFGREVLFLTSDRKRRTQYVACSAKLMLQLHLNRHTSFCPAKQIFGVLMHWYWYWCGIYDVVLSELERQSWVRVCVIAGVLVWLVAWLNVIRLLETEVCMLTMATRGISEC